MDVTKLRHLFEQFDELVVEFLALDILLAENADGVDVSVREVDVEEE